MPPIGRNADVSPMIAKLFKPVGQEAVGGGLIKKGDLVRFNYSFWIHDPYPLVMVTDVFNGSMIRGVNLHYLTFPYMKTLLKLGCHNMSFSYRNIGGDAYISNAFRSYKWQGIRQIKKLDCAFILNAMSLVRSFDPQQIKAIRQEVMRQIQREVNPPAKATVPTTPTINQAQTTISQPPQGPTGNEV
jgi:hypothetical protein